MTVDREDDVLRPCDAIAQVRDQLAVFPRCRVAHRVGHVQGGGAGGRRRGEDLDEIVGIRPGRVLRRELDVVDVAPGLAHGPIDLLEDLLAAHPQLVFQVDIAGRDEGVDPRPTRRLDGPPRALDVHLARPRESADDRVLELLGNRPHRLEIPVAGNREARLDHVHPQPLQLSGEGELLLQIHAAARRLLAVAQGRVEDPDRLGAHLPPSLPRPSPAPGWAVSGVTFGSASAAEAASRDSPPIVTSPGSTGSSSRPVRQR